MKCKGQIKFYVLTIYVGVLQELSLRQVLQSCFASACEEYTGTLTLRAYDFPEYFVFV
jgi:hypothetical protein